MDNDMPAEHNTGMADAYAKLAGDARLRAAAESNAELKAQFESAAGQFQRLADLYAQRYYLTTGYRA